MRIFFFLQVFRLIGLIEVRIDSEEMIFDLLE